MSEALKPRTTPHIPAPTRRAGRATVAGAVGNMLEQYDATIYAFSAITLSALFFPAGDPAVSLIGTFAIYAVGFAARPVGALIYGHIGDRYGRRSALFWSVLLMAVCTIAIGLLPVYAQVGFLAPLLLTIIRLGQGIATAGETAGSAAFIVEHAPDTKRGFLGSWQQVSSASGFLLASLVTLLMAVFFTPEELAAWAWRLPFLFAILTGVVAIWLRFGVEESPAFVELKVEKVVTPAPLRDSLRNEWRSIVRAICFVALWSIGYYLFLTYIPTYLQTVAGMDRADAQASNLVALVVFAVLIPVSGALSDRIGRKPLLLVGTIGFIVLSIPVMVGLASGSVFAAYALQALTAVLLASFAGAGPATLAEMFPARVRYTAMSIGWNVSNTIFGGLAALAATGLIALTQWTAAPALLAIIAGLVTLGAVIFTPETAKKPLPLD